MRRDLPGDWIELPDALLYYEPGFIPDSAALFRTLAEQVPWRQERIRLYGRELPIPRLNAWYGDPGARYGYSGIILEPLPWLAPLAALRQRLETHLEQRFNSALLNYYRGGADSMGLHSDDEPELGPQPVIATLSLGAERKLVLRHRRRDAAWRGVLGDGSLLVMAGPCQRHWRHGVPKSARPLPGRISLTYRQIVAAESRGGAGP